LFLALLLRLLLPPGGTAALPFRDIVGYNYRRRRRRHPAQYSKEQHQHGRRNPRSRRHQRRRRCFVPRYRRNRQQHHSCCCCNNRGRGPRCRVVCTLLPPLSAPRRQSRSKSSSTPDRNLCATARTRRNSNDGSGGASRTTATAPTRRTSWTGCGFGWKGGRVGRVRCLRRRCPGGSES